MKGRRKIIISLAENRLLRIMEVIQAEERIVVRKTLRYCILQYSRIGRTDTECIEGGIDSVYRIIFNYAGMLVGYVTASQPGDRRYAGVVRFGGQPQLF